MSSIAFQLAVECCRQVFATLGDRRIHELAGQVDWRSFRPIVRFHRVQGLVWSGLRSASVEYPPEVGRALASDAAGVVAANLAIARECDHLRAEFERARVPLLFVKGLTVGALAYPEPLLKMGWDIDLLVAPEQVGSAANQLASLGYLPILPNDRGKVEHWHRRRKESVWTHESGFFVELHSRLADNARLIPDIGIQSQTQTVEIAPGIRLPTLARDELFAYLCVHGASSLWFRLKWITDLAAILHKLDAAEIAWLYDRSQELGAGRAAAQALLLADKVYGTLGRSALRSRLERDRASRWLASAAYRQVAFNQTEPTGALLGTARIHWTQLLLKPSLGFKLAELSRQVSDALG